MPIEKPGPLPGFTINYDRKLQDQYVFKALSKPLYSPQTWESKPTQSSQLFFTSKVKKQSDADLFAKKQPRTEEGNNIFAPSKQDLLKNLEENLDQKQERKGRNLIKTPSDTLSVRSMYRNEDRQVQSLSSPKNYLDGVNPIFEENVRSHKNLSLDLVGLPPVSNE